MSERSWNECSRKATGFLDGLPGQRVAARTDVEGVAAALRRPLPEEEGAGAARNRGADRRRRAGSGGNAIGPVLRLGDRWRARRPCRPGDLDLGPNTGLLASSPTAAGAEWVASEWLLSLLNLPANSAVGFVTGAMMANFTCLGAARHDVLRRAGWDVERAGLHRAPDA